MKRSFLFTSESVTEGHPDKLCDKISDSVLEECLKLDKNAKVACETATKTNMIILFGEISTTAKIDFDALVRNVLKEIGYNDIAIGMDYKTVNILQFLEEQSPEIAKGVHKNKKPEEIGAGDQGHVFGYATSETTELMPFSHLLAHQLTHRLSEVRKKNILPWVRPDGKSQVVIEYKEHDKGKLEVVRVDTVLISIQHAPDVDNERISNDLREYVIDHVIPSKYLDEKTKFIFNPSGSFVVGGPYGDAGLTGRKIIVDTYGGWSCHGGGAFSGKDPSKVDRSAAYAARWAAKSLVAAGFCERVTIQISYAIGIAEPLSVHVDSYESTHFDLNDLDLKDIVIRNFDFRPGCIIRDLNLLEIQFSKTAAYGHFGRKRFPWEQPKDLSHEKLKLKI